MTAVFLAAFLALETGACGSGGMSADNSGETVGSEDISGSPGGGKWVDSDVIGTVKPEDDIRLQDDFAAAVNKDYIATAVVDPAYEEASLVLDATKLIYERSMEIASDDPLMSDNALIYKKWIDLYSDWDARDDLGVEPVRKYITDIQNISSIDGLTEYLGSTEKNPFGLGMLRMDSVGAQLQFPDKSTLNLKAPDLSLGSVSSYVEFTGGTLAAKERTDEAVGYFLSRLGFSENEIRTVLAGNYRVETFIARNSGIDNFTVSESFTQAQKDRQGISDMQGGYPLFHYTKTTLFTKPSAAICAIRLRSSSGIWAITFPSGWESASRMDSSPYPSSA